MNESLLESLASMPTTEVVRRAGVEDFLARHEYSLLLFTGNTEAKSEGLDVAIVVREIIKKYGDRLVLGIADRRDETATMAKVGVVVLPAVAFIRKGKTREVVARMRDWPVYAQAVERLFADERD